MIRLRYQQAAFQQRNAQFPKSTTPQDFQPHLFPQPPTAMEHSMQYPSDSKPSPTGTSHTPAQSLPIQQPSAAHQPIPSPLNQQPAQSQPKPQPPQPATALLQTALQSTQQASSPPPPTIASNPLSQPPTTHTRTAEEKQRRRKRKAEAKRLRALSIDKASYLASVLNDDLQDHGSEDEIDEHSHVTVEERSKPFGPLNFKAPEGPDYFFDSIPEESSPSDAAAKVKTALADLKKQKSNEDGIRGTAALTTSLELSREDDSRLFLSLAKRDPPKASEPELGKEKFKKSLVILRDENGEQLPPWLLHAANTEKVLYSSDSSVALHYEVLEFVRFIEPTGVEKLARENTVARVKSIVKALWPECNTELFGSYATGIFLPSSDIDICVTNTPAGGEKTEFEQLAQAIRNVTGFARRVNIVDAKVKLVKIISSEGSINCDITIGVRNGPDYVPSIKKYLSTYPALRPLLLVVKCFLQQRNLNEVYSGGLGSYSVLLLVVSHLQMLRYNFPSSKANLGALLQQFFQLYGKTFNICMTGIQIRENGRYFDKFERFHTPPHETLRFSIEDPNDETNHLGTNGFSALRIRRAFARASNALVSWRRDDGTTTPTPLGTVLNVDDVFLSRRRTVLEDFQKKGQTALRESVASIASVSNRRPPSPERRRERDPRLAKRQRTIGGDQHGRGMSRGVHNVTKSNEPVQNRLQMPQAGNAMYLANSGMYNPNMAYPTQASGYSISSQQYSAATPGFQYVNPSMVSGVIPAQVFNTGMNTGLNPAMNTGVIQVPVPQMQAAQRGRNDGYSQNDRYAQQDNYGQHDGYAPRSNYYRGRRRGRPYPHRRGGGRNMSGYNRYQ